MDFKDQYKHPNWQRKRLEALGAAGFACQRCYDDASQLHVHHKHYVKGRRIWEYEISELAVLCETCHEETHAIKDMLGELLMSLDPEGYSELVSIIASYCNEVSGPCSSNAQDIVDRINDPHGRAVGSVAAQITNLFLGVVGLVDLSEKIRLAAHGDLVTVKILKKPSGATFSCDSQKETGSDNGPR